MCVCVGGHWAPETRNQDKQSYQEKWQRRGERRGEEGRGGDGRRNGTEKEDLVTGERT